METTRYYEEYPKTSFVDPDPDPFVSGPPGSVSGFVSQKYGSGSGTGSGSFHHQAKIVALISTVFNFLMTF
jgi:hypothetical protein